MKNIKEIEKIYCNLERLIDDYADLPEALEAHNKAMSFLEQHKMPEKIRLDVDDLLCNIACQNEKQGFIYGFRYAIQLLIGEAGAAG